jgi:hypothetical protein
VADIVRGVLIACLQLAQPANTQLVAAEAERDALAQELESLRRARAQAEREAAEIKDHALGKPLQHEVMRV